MSEGSGPSPRPLHVMLVAGEPSGDGLGAGLMAALRARAPGIRFSGVGGPDMIAEGLDPLYPITDLSVMGFAEILPRLRLILARLRETVAWARERGPDALVTIDYPVFNRRLAARLVGAGFPLIQYVAPTVWVWRPGRARKMAAIYDHLITLFPFEPPYFEAEGLATTFAGHPALASGTARGDGGAFRAQYGIPAGAPAAAVLPGSRRLETSRLLPVFGAALTRLKGRHPDLRAIVPTIGPVADEVERAVAKWTVPAIVLRERADKPAAFAAADVALAASGTVTLELALAGVPMVVAYRVSPLTAAIARWIVRIRYVNLLNIVLGWEAIPERLQRNCTPDALADAAGALLERPEAARVQREAASEALIRLGRATRPDPSAAAAEAVLSVIAARREAQAA